MDLGGTPNLVLLSSNLLQDPPLGGEVFQQWLAEVKNAGSTTVCLVSIEVSFQDSTGTVLASFSTFLDGDPYVSSGSSLTIPCIAPGQIAGVYTNNFSPTGVPLDAVTRIAVKLDPLDAGGAVPSDHAPIITGNVTPVFTSEFGITGTITGVSAPIHNIAVTFYPRDPRGLVLGQLEAVDLDTLDPGAAFAFTTLGVSTSFTEYRQFSDFIDGPKTNVQAPLETPSPAVRVVASRLAVRRERTEAVRHRREVARSH